MNALFTLVATAAVVALGGLRLYVAERRNRNLDAENENLSTKVEQLEFNLDVQKQINADLRRHLPNLPDRIDSLAPGAEDYRQQLNLPTITEADIARGDAYAGPGIRAMLAPRRPPWGSLHHEH